MMGFLYVLLGPCEEGVVVVGLDRIYEMKRFDLGFATCSVDAKTLGSIARVRTLLSKGNR